MGKFTSFLWLGTRVGVAGGAVYALNEQKVWSSNTDTDAIYSQMRQAVPQEVAEATNTYITPYLPSTKHLHLDVSQHWNSGVLFTFNFLSNLPEHATNAAQYTSALASQAFSSVTDAASDEAATQAPVVTPASPAPAENTECCSEQKKQE